MRGVTVANRAQRRAQQRGGTHPGNSRPGQPSRPITITNPATDGVIVAYCHPVGEVNARFHTSLIDLMRFESVGGMDEVGRQVGGKNRIVGHMPLSSGANIVTARNKIVKAFLEHPWGSTPEWLWFIDSDMTFDANILDILLQSADVKERPVMGGLCFAMMKGEAQEIVPTIYGMSTQGSNLVRYSGYPPDTVVQVAGTGAACLLIHRSVLETMRDAAWTAENAPSPGMVGQLMFPPPWPWFQETVTGRNWGDSLSEDLTFCLRAQQCGFPVFVDTRAKTGHVKPVVIDEEYFFAHLPPQEGPAPTYVGIPVKGNHDMTRNILAQIREQGGYEHIFLFDNGADTDPVPNDLWDGRHDDISYFDASGYRFHRMWNDIIRQSIARETRCNVAILNNDLILGDNFLEELAKGLRSHGSFIAVCGNYDGRDFPELVQGVKGTAGGRMDGTGGFAGFGFMLRGEICSMGLMFDENYNLWYGDDDLCEQIDQSGGGTYGIVRDAHMEHIGGGSNTSGDGQGHRLSPEWAELVEQDRLYFLNKWRREAVA